VGANWKPNVIVVMDSAAPAMAKTVFRA